MPDLNQEFPTNWLKINKNCISGDTITFMDKGEIERKGTNPDGTDKVAFNITVRVERTQEEKIFGMNATNRKATIALYSPDTEKWVDKQMKIEKVKVNNPSTGQLVDSIALVNPE
jgi:hypothetical protein